MAKRSFGFTEEAELVLCNLPTVREIQHVCAELLPKETTRFLKHLEVVFQDQVEPLSEWKSDIDSNILYFWPGTSWEVIKNDCIAVFISVDQLVEPAFYSDEDDPYVGLYIPAKWKHASRVVDLLRPIVPSSFKQIDSDEFDENYPFWSTVRLTPLTNRGTLMLDRIEHELMSRVAKLVDLRPRIDRVIQRVKKS
jgi:hypothetical protein